jgi:hypothetical protein
MTKSKSKKSSKFTLIKYESDQDGTGVSRHPPVPGSQARPERSRNSSASSFMLFSIGLLGTSARVARCALDETGCHSGGVQLVVSSSRGVSILQAGVGIPRMSLS